MLFHSSRRQHYCSGHEHFFSSLCRRNTGNVTIFLFFGFRSFISTLSRYFDGKLCTINGISCRLDWTLNSCKNYSCCGWKAMDAKRKSNTGKHLITGQEWLCASFNCSDKNFHRNDFSWLISVWRNGKIFSCAAWNWFEGDFFYNFLAARELIGLSCFGVYFCFVWSLADVWAWFICLMFTFRNRTNCFFFLPRGNFACLKLNEWSLTRFKLTIGFTIPIAVTPGWCLKVHLWVVHICHRCHCVVIALAELARFGPYCGREEKSDV